MLTTNRAVTQWGHVFGDDVLATAILDRLLHHAHTLTTSGESYGLKQRRKAGFFGGIGRTKPLCEVQRSAERTASEVN